MRIDKNDRRMAYRDYWDWLQTGYNLVWLFSLFVGYIYYLMITEEA